MSGVSGIDLTNSLQRKEQRNLKNNGSRSRVQSHRTEIGAIKRKSNEQMTEEDVSKLAAHDAQRFKKNQRSRERMGEMQMEVDRILGKPVGQRSTHESKYVEDVKRRNMRKIEGDRLRRLRNRLGNRLGNPEDLKLPPLPHRKGTIVTTVNLQMNKICKEYSLRSNKPMIEARIEEYCQEEPGSVILDSSVIPYLGSHWLEVQRNLHSNIDDADTALMWQGENYTQSLSSASENPTTNDIIPANQQLFVPMWRPPSPLLYQADFTTANSSLSAAAFNRSLMGCRDGVQSSPSILQRQYQQHCEPPPAPWQHFQPPLWPPPQSAFQDDSNFFSAQTSTSPHLLAHGPPPPLLLRQQLFSLMPARDPTRSEESSAHGNFTNEAASIENPDAIFWTPLSFDEQLKSLER